MALEIGIAGYVGIFYQQTQPGSLTRPEPEAALGEVSISAFGIFLSFNLPPRLLLGFVWSTDTGHRGARGLRSDGRALGLALL
jgi:hypothetical protein